MQKIYFRGPKQLIQNKTNINLLVASAKDDVVAITLEGIYKICCRHEFLYTNKLGMVIFENF